MVILVYRQVCQRAGCVRFIIPVASNQVVHVLALRVVSPEPLLEVVLVSVPARGGGEEVEGVVPLLGQASALLPPFPVLILASHPCRGGRQTSISEAQASSPLCPCSQPAHQAGHPP